MLLAIGHIEDSKLQRIQMFDVQILMQFLVVRSDVGNSVTKCFHFSSYNMKIKLKLVNVRSNHVLDVKFPPMMFTYFDSKLVRG